MQPENTARLMSATDDAPKVFDRKFVFAASLIGIAYALFMALLAHVATPAVAGAAGVALTSVATAIFKQFENLRFRQVAEDRGVTVEVLKFRFGPFVAAVIACSIIVFAIPMIVGFSMLAYRLSFYPMKDSADLSRAFAMSAEFGMELGSNPWIVFTVRLVTIMAHALFGALCASVAPKRVAYWYAIAAALTLQLLDPVVLTIMWVVSKAGNSGWTPQYTIEGIWSAAYVSAAFAGALLWGRRREKRYRR